MDLELHIYDSEAFECERGACPQGGIESCYVCFACTDLMLATIRNSGGDPLIVPVGADDVVEV
jgi:hypothetical protein